MHHEEQISEGLHMYRFDGFEVRAAEQRNYPKPVIYILG